MMTNIRCR